MLHINKSRLPQIIEIPGIVFPATVLPGMVCDLSMFRQNSYDNEAFVEFKHEMLMGKNRIAIVRKYAMGDLIQLVPVVRRFQKQFKVKQIDIITMDDIIRQLQPLYRDISWRGEGFVNTAPTGWYDNLLNLDGIIERDHSLTNEERNIHRINIYGRFLGVGDSQIKDLDWSITPPKASPTIPMEPKMKKIALQLRGSGRMKTLPESLVKRIATTLSTKYQVFLIDHEKGKGFSGKNIVNTAGMFNVHQCVAFLEKMDCCICMDSGILWLTHSAKCPVLTIFGPTREQERLSLHPKYPDKAKGLSISQEIINCVPCYETQNRCGRQVNCMNNFNQDKFIELVISKIQSIVGE